MKDTADQQRRTLTPQEHQGIVGGGRGGASGCEQNPGHHRDIGGEESRGAIGYLGDGAQAVQHRNGQYRRQAEDSHSPEYRLNGFGRVQILGALQQHGQQGGAHQHRKHPGWLPERLRKGLPGGMQELLRRQ